VKRSNKIKIREEDGDSKSKKGTFVIELHPQHDFIGDEDEEKVVEDLMMNRAMAGSKGEKQKKRRKRRIKVKKHSQLMNHKE